MRKKHKSVKTIEKISKIEEVENFWNENLPQSHYTTKEEGTREYYDEIQKVRYNDIYFYLPELAGFDKHKNEKVLEVGCGQGTDLLQFAKGGAKVTGIDLVDSGIKKTTDMFKMYGYKVDLKKANVEDLNCFKDNSFDAVYCFGVLHHTPNTQKGIDEIYRVLKPNGQAKIMMYGKGLHYYHKVFRYYLFGMMFLEHSLAEVLNIHGENIDAYCPVVKFYRKRQVRKMFNKFTNIKINKVHSPFLYGKMPFFLYKIARRIVGNNFFIRCTK